MGIKSKIEAGNLKKKNSQVLDASQQVFLCKRFCTYQLQQH